MQGGYLHKIIQQGTTPLVQPIPQVNTLEAETPLSSTDLSQNTELSPEFPLENSLDETNVIEDQDNNVERSEYEKINPASETTTVPYKANDIAQPITNREFVSLDNFTQNQIDVEKIQDTTPLPKTELESEATRDHAPKSEAKELMRPKV